MTKLEFARGPGVVLASLDEHCLQIGDSWTVLIPRKDAIKYVHNYGSSPNEGFFEHDGKVMFSHNSGKIWFSLEEAQAIVNLIKSNYYPV